jgi:glycine/D-amino acid oxidase-like deaminating enzyme
VSTAFTQAHLITGEGREYDDATVRIERDRIVEVETNGGSVGADHHVELGGRHCCRGSSTCMCT